VLGLGVSRLPEDSIASPAPRGGSMSGSVSPPLRPRSQVGAVLDAEQGPSWSTRGPRPLTWTDNHRCQPTCHVRGVSIG